MFLVKPIWDWAAVTYCYSIDKKGDTVLDLGSGGGFDCFIAARQVGETGLVIGVDMTPEMVNARTNALNGGYSNVEFRLGKLSTCLLLIILLTLSYQIV